MLCSIILKPAGDKPEDSGLSWACDIELSRLRVWILIDGLHSFWIYVYKST